MSKRVTATFGVTDADLLGSGWESMIYALGDTQILRIPRPEAGSEDQVRARAAFTANLPPLPFAVPCVREISKIDGQLYVIEDRIAGQSMAALLPKLSGTRRATALRSYLAAAEAMSVTTAPGEAFGDLLLDQPRRCDRWSDYLTARVRKPDPGFCGQLTFPPGKLRTPRRGQSTGISGPVMWTTARQPFGL